MSNIWLASTGLHLYAQAPIESQDSLSPSNIADGGSEPGLALSRRNSSAIARYNTLVDTKDVAADKECTTVWLPYTESQEFEVPPLNATFFHGNHDSKHLPAEINPPPLLGSAKGPVMSDLLLTPPSMGPETTPYSAADKLDEQMQRMSLSNLYDCYAFHNDEPI